MNLRITTVPSRDPTQCVVGSMKGRPTLQCAVDPHEKAAVYNLKPSFFLKEKAMSEAAIYIFILSQCLHIATSDCSNKLKNTNYFSKVTTNNQPSCINQSLLKSCA